MAGDCVASAIVQIAEEDTIPWSPPRLNISLAESTSHSGEDHLVGVGSEDKRSHTHLKKPLQEAHSPPLLPSV